MSVFPMTCNVGVSYESPNILLLIGSDTLNPETETQNWLEPDGLMSDQLR